MTNRELVDDAIKDEIARGTEIGVECEAWIEAWDDDADCEGHTLADAFRDAWSVAEDNGERRLIKACVDLMIRLGYYQPRTGEVMIAGGRDRSPIRGGQRYDCVASWCEWIER